MRERDRQSSSRRRAEREREREGDTESGAGSRLWAISTEPGVGLKLTNCEIMTWAGVRCSSDWATRRPAQNYFFLKQKLFVPGVECRLTINKTDTRRCTFVKAIMAALEPCPLPPHCPSRPPETPVWSPWEPQTTLWIHFAFPSWPRQD